MAESKNNDSSSRQSKSGGSSSKGQPKNGGSSKQQSARDVVRAAAEQLPELIGRPVEAVLGVEKDDNEWAVSVEVLELERVPNTTDVLGKYEVRMNGDGDIVAAKRTRRYLRSQSGDE